jgi:hypothetical protein
MSNNAEHFTDFQRDLMIMAILESGSTQHPVPTHDNLPFFTRRFLIDCATAVMRRGTWRTSLAQNTYMSDLVNSVQLEALQQAVNKLRADGPDLRRGAHGRTSSLYRCVHCGHEVMSTGTPLAIRWDDGHTCCHWQRIEEGK